jgi:AcrR family transcriptional regulator
MSFDLERVNADMHNIDQDPETQRRILAVAGQLFLTKGFKGVSMKDIADEVQVTPAALYYYFPQGKQEIFVSVINQSIDNWSEQVMTEISKIEGIRSKLIYMTEIFFARRFGNFVPLMRDVKEFLHENAQSKKLLLQRHQQRRELLVHIFQQGIDDGELALTYPATVYVTLYEGMLSGIQFGRSIQTMHATSKSESEEQKSANSPEMARIFINCLFDGIAIKDSH